MSDHAVSYQEQLASLAQTSYAYTSKLIHVQTELHHQSNPGNALIWRG